MTPINHRQHTICLPLVFLIALACNPKALRADSIFTNFDADTSYAPGAGLIVSNDSIAGASVAIAFTPSANYSLTSIEFVDSYLIPGDSSSVTLGIFGDNGGMPGSTPLELFTVKPLGAFGDSLLVTTVPSILDPLLLAGNQYWVGLNAAPGDILIWNQNVTSASGFAETDGLGNWSAADPLQPQGVLQVNGDLSAIQPLVTNSLPPAVPEPAVWTLMALGLTALALLRRLSVGHAPLAASQARPSFPDHKQ